MTAAQNKTTLGSLILLIGKPFVSLKEYLALRRASPPLGGINITPTQNYPISRSSHLSEISRHDLVEPER